MCQPNLFWFIFLMIKTTIKLYKTDNYLASFRKIVVSFKTSDVTLFQSRSSELKFFLRFHVVFPSFLLTKPEVVSQKPFHIQSFPPSHRFTTSLPAHNHLFHNTNFCFQSFEIRSSENSVQSGGFSTLFLHGVKVKVTKQWKNQVSNSTETTVSVYFGDSFIPVPY
jgi:hypothetical protein